MDSFESRMNPRFLSESEKGMLSEPKVIESGRKTVEGFKEDEKEKRRASVLSSLRLSWFSVIHVFMSSVPASSSLVRLHGHIAERRGFMELCVIYISYDIGERCSVQDEENWPQYWARRHTVHVIVMKTSYLLKWTDICLRDIIIITHSFYIALFSALEQTHCAHWHVILNERLQPFIARIINIHRSGVG